MIGIEDIIRILESRERHGKTHKLPLSEALGAFLPSPVYAALDSPPFDKAAMDGWAVCKDDEEGPWTIRETVAAGDLARFTLKKGECSAIMTGAKIPEGCGKIIRVEYTEKTGDKVSLKQAEPLENIIFQGENIKEGELLLTPRRLGPADIGILASTGLAELETAIPPRIGIITTGSEIRDPGETLNDGEIYNSNGSQLAAQAREAGCSVKYYGIVADDEEAIRNAIAGALDETEILLLSGGVSMGEFDFVPSVLQDLGVVREFHKAAIKPGKPLWFGHTDRNFVFGLPGNPVSTYILFEVFVKHLIWQQCGVPFGPHNLRAELGKEIRRRTWDRTEFLPVRFEGNKVIPIKYHGSSHLNALSEADGLTIVDKGLDHIPAGEIINVRLL